MEKKFLSERVISFSRDVILICQELDYIKKHVISRQLMRAATSIGAACAEASQAESADDFIHKMKIASKEASETKYWFNVIDHMLKIRDPVKEELDSIQRLLTSSIATALKNKKAKASLNTQKKDNSVD